MILPPFAVFLQNKKPVSIQEYQHSGSSLDHYPPAAFLRNKDIQPEKDRPYNHYADKYFSSSYHHITTNHPLPFFLFLRTSHITSRTTTKMHPRRNSKPGCEVTVSAIFTNISGAPSLTAPAQASKESAQE